MSIFECNGVLSVFMFQAEPLRVLVTGAAGQIAYSLLYSIGKGDVFGPKQVGLASSSLENKVKSRCYFNYT